MAFVKSASSSGPWRVDKSVEGVDSCPISTTRVRWPHRWWHASDDHVHHAPFGYCLLYERPAVILPSSPNMPSESQLKSFIRNRILFSGVGAMGNALSRDDATRQTPATAMQPSTVQADATRHPDLPKPTPPTHPRVPSLPHATMTSHRPTKKGKDKAVGDDRRSHVHPLRRLSEAPDADKNRVSAELLPSSDLAASATSEAERLRREIEVLKKTVHEQKKVIKKQSKVWYICV
jgi:hypothetical protein